MLQLILLLLLHHHLILVELLDRLAVNFLEKIWRLGTCENLAVVALRLTTDLVWLLFNPQVFRRLKVISKNRDDLLDLVI